SPTRGCPCSQPDSQEAVEKKPWDERVDIEEEREVFGSTNNKDDAAKGKPIPVGLNGVDRPAMGESIDGACNGGGVMASYGIHSPKGLNDSNGTLMAMIQSTKIQSEEQTEVKRNGKAIVDRLGTQEDTLINDDSQQQEGGSYGSNTSNKTTQHVEEGWETPKRRPTCRAKDLVLTSQIGDINQGGTQDWQAQGNGPQDKDLAKDAIHDRSKGGELGQGLETP
ncbi:hypothetical protein FRX31_024117, partial [Thalictrum thalictroides]